MSERIAAEGEGGGHQQLTHPQPAGDDDEDWIDTGAAVLSFYCTLVDLLGRCAPEASVIGMNIILKDF